MPTLFKSGSTAGRAKPGRKSIRGTISAPIPIPTSDDDEFPFRNQGSNKALATNDDEFPIRKPGAGMATPLPPGDEFGSSPEEPVGQSEERELAHENSNQGQGAAAVPVSTGSSTSTGASRGSQKDQSVDIRPEPPLTPPPAPPTGAVTLVGRPPSRSQSGSPPFRSSTRRTSPPRNSPPRISPPARRATNPVLSTVRYSVVSESPSKQSSQSKDAPQRKKSTLRTALGRLFGRRKKQSSGSESGPLTSTQHQSDPTALTRTNQRSPHRSASVPISEFDLPLRSHSIGPDDILAIESARNSLHVDAVSGVGPTSTGPGGRRRAATAGSRMLLRPHLRNQEWGAGLSPRPASAQGRGSRLGARDEPEDPNDIGRAITSDSGHGLRRRSRSLSGLQDLAGIQSSGRRRSDEIRYWRESYDPGFMSPMSSNVQEDIDDTGGPDVSAPESPAVERPAKTPPQPFNFNLLSKEMIGMKITHAADIDTRLANLESRTIHLERALSKLSDLVPGFRGALNMNSKPRLQPSTSQLSLNSDFSTAQPPTLNSPPIPSLPVFPLTRPTSNSTITVRGAASLPILNRDAPPPPTDELLQLRNDLEAERAARQALEAQVKKLSERVNTLSSTMFAMVRGPGEARSNERLGSSVGTGVGGSSPLLSASARSVGGSVSGGGVSGKGSREMLSVSVSGLGVGGGSGLGGLRQGQEQQTSVFEMDDDEQEEEEDEEEGEEGEGGNKSGKRASSSSSSSSSTSSPIRTDLVVEEGEITEDDFQTPREVKTPGVAWGAFGEELRADDDDGGVIDNDGSGGPAGDGREDDPKRKKAAKTLSLSQLTLGKGQRGGI